MAPVMTLFVTGAGGFIGRHVVANLLLRGHSVRALVRGAHTVGLAAHPKLVVVSADLASVDDNALSGCDILIHLAAHGVVDGADDWDACFAVNVSQSIELWRRAIRCGVRRLVICGSCFEYGRSGERYDYIPDDAPLEPTGAYHASKAAASMAALAMAVQFKCEVLILRPFHVYGEGEAMNRFWPSLRRAALSGADFPMTSGEQVRDFISVVAIAEIFANASCIWKVSSGLPEIHNLGSGCPKSLYDFALEWWGRWARGRLLPGVVSQRPNEVMRYVPRVSTRCMEA
jgi:nucleoside-diphosphate-sugar epimerase